MMGFFAEISLRHTERNQYGIPSVSLLTHWPTGVSPLLIPTSARESPKNLIIKRAMLNWPPAGKLSKSQPSTNRTLGLDILLVSLSQRRQFFRFGPMRHRLQDLASHYAQKQGVIDVPAPQAPRFA